MTPKEFLESPDDWPQWPILPVVSRKGWKEPEGFVFYSNLKKVYLSNIFMIPKDITTLECREFETTDALLKEYRID